jgi:Zn-finger nucleic acid-binding protein
MLSDRQGIEIDFCSQCRGVWLDRGELDKIIERASRYREDRHDDRDDDGGRRDRGRDDDDDWRYRKRKSFWTELFD